MQTNLGLLGLGGISTAYYVEQLNALYHQQQGGYSTCPFYLLNANFEEINPLLPEPSKVLQSITYAYLHRLQSFGVRHIIVPNVTLHQSIDQLSQKIPFADDLIVHPVVETIKALQDNGHLQATIFATPYTTQSEAMSQAFAKAGIFLNTPSLHDQNQLDLIRKRIYEDPNDKEALALFHFLLGKYSDRAPVVLACTEHSIAYHNQSHDMVFDMAMIQIKSALSRAFGI